MIVHDTWCLQLCCLFFYLNRGFYPMITSTFSLNHLSSPLTSLLLWGIQDFPFSWRTQRFSTADMSEPVLSVFSIWFLSSCFLFGFSICVFSLVSLLILKKNSLICWLSTIHFHISGLTLNTLRTISIVIIIIIICYAVKCRQSWFVISHDHQSWIRSIF